MKACVAMFGAGEEGLVRGYERPIMRCEAVLFASRPHCALRDMLTCNMALDLRFKGSELSLAWRGIVM
jgi:hypothetical protein